MSVAYNIRLWRPILQLAAVAVLLLPLSAIAGGQRPATQRLLLDGEKFRTLSVTYDGVAQGGVAAAQSGVPAAIYRSTGCGFQSWIGGQPAWLDQMILFNDGGVGAPLRSYSTEVCYDTCHRGNRCIGGTGPADCDCMSCGDLPFDANLQLYDGDPCGSGTAIAGTQGTITITQADIPCFQLGDGDSHCFTLTVNVDPKVQIPHEVWIEAQYGIDDAWPLLGRPNFLEGQGESPLSGYDDGVACVTFCDRWEPECTNDADYCDWILVSAASNAEVVMSVVPTGNDKDGNLDPGVVIDGNTITLPTGGRFVFFEIRIGDWDPNDTGVAVRAYQYVIDAGGYSNDLQGRLSRATRECTTNGQCTSLFGPGSVCDNSESGCGASQCCKGHFINENRSDFVFLGLNHLCAVDLSLRDQRGACVLISGSAPAPNPFPAEGLYGGTFILDVPADARGTFTAPFNLSPVSALLDQDNQFIPLIGYADATIILPAPCCFADGTCDETLFEVDCINQGGTVVTSCEDTNNNGLADLCETGGCCTGATCGDSNFADCSALGGTLVPTCFGDTDNSGADDACECVQATAPEPFKLGGDFQILAKNRFLTVSGGDSGRAQAIRVSYVQLPPPFDVWNGREMFVGRPRQACENSGQGLATPVQDCGPAPGSPQRWFWAAPLVCDRSQAAFRDWTTLSAYCVGGTNDARPCADVAQCPGGQCGSDGLIHLYHTGVVPSKLETPKGPIEIAATYDIQLVDSMCDLTNEANYSTALTLQQAGWTDTNRDCMSCPCSRPNERLDLITDCVGILDKFRNDFCALAKSRAEMGPSQVDMRINISDVLYCVGAFAAESYPFSPGDPCP